MPPQKILDAYLRIGKGEDVAEALWDDFGANTIAARGGGRCVYRRPRRRRISFGKMGADICVQTESLNRTYGRPALRKAFAAFPADSKVA